MKIRAVMTKSVRFIAPRTSLSEAGAIMKENDCGTLPVVDDEGRVAGILTDRDICLALTGRDRRASEVHAAEVMSPKVFSCGPDEDIQSALATMRNKQVRRLPVVGDDGKLEGILSMDDIVLQASPELPTTPPGVTSGEALGALQGIYKSRPVRRKIVIES